MHEDNGMGLGYNGAHLTDQGGEIPVLFRVAERGFLYLLLALLACGAAVWRW